MLCLGSTEVTPNGQLGWLSADPNLSEHMLLQRLISVLCKTWEAARQSERAREKAE